ncbi:MAG: 16S rRNA processing protein RimM [Actinobacteria bacterium]|nr:16S rRNA processing protein RimM [Actinomycetota bacterium]
MTDRPDLLLAGEIGKPHGTAGEVYVVPISDDPQRFERGSILVHEDGRELVVEGSRRHRTRFLVKFEGSDSRDQAERLRGALFVGVDHVRELDADEYWPHDLIGCDVVTTSGGALGEVRRIVPGAAQDLLVVGSDEALIPMVKEIVVSVDTGARRVVIDPPEGLL